jgi:hypothetical protein
MLLSVAVAAAILPSIRPPGPLGISRPTRYSTPKPVSDEEADDGSALFRPYSADDEELEVPDASKRLFVAILGAPTLALLAGIVTYAPTDEELRQDQDRKAKELLRLRGGALTSSGGHAKRRREANAAGNLFVDESCIDCDTCRWMAPSTYGRANGRSFVHA